MNELYDKLIIRIIFTIFICIVIALYKYAHSFLYPSAKMQLFKKFYPAQNGADTIHLFSRIIGIGIVYSEFYFYVSDGILLAIVDFFIRATLASIVYLISLYVLESIVLYNFEYNDEILKRKNYAYSIVCFANAVVIAILLKAILKTSSNSIIIFTFLWLFSLVIIGFATKSYHLISKLQFNKMMVQKSMALAFSYTGFLWGWGIIISTAISSEINDIRWYTIQVILKIILSIIIFPLFRKGLIMIFALQVDDIDKNGAHNDIPDIGYGVYEGTILFTSSFLVSIITDHIYFGTFYPIF